MDEPSSFSWYTVLIAIISGLAASLATPIVSHLFQNKKDTHNRKQRILDEISNKVSEVVTKGYDYILNDPSEYKAHFYKSSNQLEGLGEIELANNIREFMLVWESLNRVITKDEKDDIVYLRKLGKLITTTKVK